MFLFYVGVRNLILLLFVMNFLEGHFFAFIGKELEKKYRRKNRTMMKRKQKTVSFSIVCTRSETTKGGQQKKTDPGFLVGNKREELMSRKCRDSTKKKC